MFGAYTQKILRRNRDGGGGHGGDDDGGEDDGDDEDDDDGANDDGEYRVFAYALRSTFGQEIPKYWTHKRFQSTIIQYYYNSTLKISEND